LDNDPLRPIGSEDLEQVTTTSAAPHLLQTREGTQILRHKIDAPSRKDSDPPVAAEEFDAQMCAVENALASPLAEGLSYARKEEG
jgi:hypothetical protein